MGNKIYINGKFAYRADTLERWEEHNSVLERGEPAVVTDATDENWLKLGDGVHTWNELPYKHGPKGEKGEQGIQGSDGPEGPKGDKGDTGADGKSAYEIALDNGFEGTEDDWLVSLKGDTYTLTEADKGDIAVMVASYFTDVSEVGQ